MNRLRHYLLVRHRHNWALLTKFAVVGGSGVVVNLLVFGLLTHVDGRVQDVFYDLPYSDYNVRGYHIYSTVAFLVANLSNFQLNRVWTFRSVGRAPWLSEFVPFFIVGLLGQVLGLMILTGLLHHGSPFSIPSGELLDGSTTLRSREIWAQMLTIAIVTPVSFVGNKLWTFRVVRGDARRDPDAGDDDEGDDDGLAA